MTGKGWFKFLSAVLLAVFALCPARAGQIANGNFEDGARGWSFRPAEDHALIEVIEDPGAPSGGRVLLVEHGKTRSSHFMQNLDLKPYSLYILSFMVEADSYARTGMGLFPRVFVDGMQFGKRFSEDHEEISARGWQRVQLAFATGESGSTSVRIYFTNMAGRLRIDNVRVFETDRAEARKLLGTEEAVPRLPLREGEAESRVFYDRIYVSPDMPSRVTFGVRANLLEGVWEASGRLHLEVPQGVRIDGRKPVLNHESVFSRYTFKAEDMRLIGAEHWLDVMLLSERAPDKDGMIRMWLEWEGGREEPNTVPVRTIAVPGVSQPRELMTGVAIGPRMADVYPDFFAMMRNLGFNTVDYWKVGAGSEHIEEFLKHGIDVDTEYSGMMELQNS